MTSSWSNDELMSGMYVTRPRDTGSSCVVGGSALPAGAPGTGGGTIGANMGMLGGTPSGPGCVRDHCVAMSAARPAATLVAPGAG